MSNRFELIARARSILDAADDQGRGLTPAERAEIDQLTAAAQAAKSKDMTDNAALAQAVAALGSRMGLEPEYLGGVVGNRTHSAIVSAGWELGNSVHIPFGAVLISDGGDAAPLREAGIISEGVDNRRLYANLPIVSLGGATRVDALVSAGRTLPNPLSDMALDIDGTGEKPQTDSAATLATFDVKMIATVSDGYPNAIVAQPAFADLVGGDMRTAYQDGLDAYVVSTVTQGAGTTDDTGDDLFEQLRKGVTALQAEGFNPTLAAVSPEDAETLDLTRTTVDNLFLLPPAPRAPASTPLWSMNVVTVKGLTDPLVLDPTAVRLYLDAVQFSSDPYTGFSTNETRFRFEGPACCVVRQPGGVYCVAMSS
jgi:hypothetical protein